MKIGDLVRFKDPDLLGNKHFPFMKETGIVMEWDGIHPVVLFPSVMKTFLKNRLVVVSKS